MRRGLILLSLLVLGLTGCGQSEVGGARNSQDELFVEHMIFHHGQAIEMTALAPDRASNERIKTLAQRIAVAQQPEIDQMKQWQSEWGLSTTTTVAGHDRHASMEGIMTPEQMEQLRNTTGLDFDRRFLELMIEHHKGAISMAVEQQQSGKTPAVIALANEIRGGQSAEVNEMQSILATL